MIQDNIKVILLEINGDRVRLGIIAPNEISVHREEVWLEHYKDLKEENK
jgi:carbon storage regulator